MEKKALVIGLGVSGKAALRFLLHHGYQVIGVDGKDMRGDKEILSCGVKVFLEKEFVLEKEISLVVISPGVDKKHPLVEDALSQNIPVIGEVELAFRYKKGRAVAITGTNGKTTVTALVEHVLQATGRKAKALGNIGIPLTEYFLHSDEENIIVAELSSYQLETLSSVVFEAAVILNITPDHLDRYNSLMEYAKAKAQIQHCLIENGPLYLYEKVVTDFLELFHKPVHVIGKGDSSFFQVKDNIVWKEREVLFSLPDEYKDMGEHDRLNALAAWALCFKLGVEKDLFLKALRTFQKPAHRIEFVCEIDGVGYYDDSKGTNIDATIQAVHSMKGSVILIVGGVDKGSSYLPWKEAFQGKVKFMIALGEASSKISQELSLFFNLKIVDSLRDAVQAARNLACEGDSVLLSPGCSSFDMFRDYAHRGREFQKFVRGEERV